MPNQGLTYSISLNALYCNMWLRLIFTRHKVQFVTLVAYILGTCIPVCVYLWCIPLCIPVDN